jgi:PAS domain S-box-containing protein
MAPHWLKFNLNSLRHQLLLSFIVLILLTAAAIGLPALWLIRDQLNRQAWAQVDQGSQATGALYAARQSEMDNLAKLTAERPTLQTLLTQNNQAEFSVYLQTLRTGAGLDLILVCSPSRQLIAQAGLADAAHLCTANPAAGIQVISMAGVTPQAWLLAIQPIATHEANRLGEIIVGIQLDDAFAGQMRTQTGLEQTLLVGNHLLATSLVGGVAAYRSSSARTPYQAPTSTLEQSAIPLTTIKRDIFYLGTQPFYASRFPLAPSGQTTDRVEVEVALPVGEVITTRQNLAWILLGGILAVTTLGSLLGLFLTRRISQPLARLTKAASRLSQGDLTSPIPADPRVQEVALVAYALEAARLDLQSTLNDLRREKAWSNHLLESIVEGIVTLDARQRITFFSQGAERITGWQRDQVIGQPCDEILRLAEPGQTLSQLLPTLDRRTKIVMTLPAGRQATLAMTGARLSPEGQPLQMALVFRDVSEEELMHHLVGHFLANIAHEFRTPLSALAASVELLLDQASDLSPAELQELLTSLHLGVLGLQTLIDNLLEGASIEAGRFRVSPRPTNLAEIISEATRTIQPLLVKRSQALQLDQVPPLPSVQADPRRTTQVLINLLSNASKYSPDETEIRVGATVVDQWVRVNVADRGPGIPSQYRTDLFRLFMRDRGSEAQQLAHGGTGLGLSVVKAIVEAQGGEVGVDDRPEGGAVFWFTLPVVTAP